VELAPFGEFRTKPKVECGRDVENLCANARADLALQFLATRWIAVLNAIPSWTQLFAHAMSTRF
jgi:hypothetical protein